MDLNEAMVQMYKQRSSANKNRRINSKRPKLNSEHNKDESSLDNNNTRLSEIEEVVTKLDYKPSTTFDQLHGCEFAQDEVIKIVKRFLRFLAGLAKKSQFPNLICGSKGLGKTSIVEAAAQFANTRLIPIVLKTLVEQSRSEFKTTLRQLEAYCNFNEPAIVLVDDLDQISEKDDLKIMVRELLVRLCKEDNKLLIFCTSTIDNISDISFTYTIQLRRPDVNARYKILRDLREKNINLKNLSQDNLKELSQTTSSFTANDIQKMLDIAETMSDGFPILKECVDAVEMVKRSFRRGTHLIGEKPAITWKDIGGLAEVRHAFIETLKGIRKGDINCKFAGIALYGPPGCGKTMIAQALANEAGLNFISIKPAELVDKFLGETEKNIRRVFSEAQEFEPCMLYFDEFDGLCGTRGNRENVTSAIQTLLSEMDGFAGRGKSIILASTNRLEDIDPAMKRPGRLSKHIYVGPPNEKARRDILNVLTRKSSIAIAKDVNLDDWARKTKDFTGAELDFLVSEAESRAISRQALVNDLSIENEQVTIINQEQFESALRTIVDTNRELGKKRLEVNS